VLGGSGRSKDDPRYITGLVLGEDLLGSRLSPCLRLVPCFVAGSQLRFLHICPSFQVSACFSLPPLLLTLLDGL